MPRSLDLDADAGERPRAADSALLPLVSSAHAACGGRTGGNAVPAVLVSTSMPSGGQPRPGDEMRFLCFGREEARRRAALRKGWLAATSGGLA